MPPLHLRISLRLVQAGVLADRETLNQMSKPTSRCSSSVRACVVVQSDRDRAFEVMRPDLEPMCTCGRW